MPIARTSLNFEYKDFAHAVSLTLSIHIVLSPTQRPTFELNLAEVAVYFVKIMFVEMGKTRLIKRCKEAINHFIIHQIFSLARDWSKRVTWANIPQVELGNIRGYPPISKTDG